MFKKILVPTDLSETDRSVLQSSLGLAVQHGAEVCLLHVIELLRDTPYEEVRDFYDRLEAAAREKLVQRAAGFEEAKVACRQSLVFGDRATEILKTAEDGGCDVIVLQARKTGPEQPTAGWGYISFKVASLAQCPVLLLR